MEVGKAGRRGQGAVVGVVEAVVRGTMSGTLCGGRGWAAWGAVLPGWRLMGMREGTAWRQMGLVEVEAEAVVLGV